MQIVIKKKPTIVVEDYSKYDSDDVFAVLADVCTKIDELGIATFNMMLSAVDERFKKIDFGHDYVSIATDIEDFMDAIIEQEKNYELYFYELGRKVVFKISNVNTSCFILDDNNEKVIACYSSKTEQLRKDTVQIVKDFEFVVMNFFPVAYELFKNEEFLFY